jgi:hypothetical protein
MRERASGLRLDQTLHKGALALALLLELGELGAFGALGLDDLGALLLRLGGGLQRQAATHDRVRVELDARAKIGERVLFARREAFLRLFGAQHRLHFDRVDDAAEIGVGHDVVRHVVLGLLGGRRAGRAVERLETLERVLRPHDEAAEVTARRQLQQIQARHVQQIDARNVAERLRDRAFLVEDHQRAELLLEATVTHFAFASTVYIEREREK